MLKPCYHPMYLLLGLMELVLMVGPNWILRLITAGGTIFPIVKVVLLLGSIRLKFQWPPELIVPLKFVINRVVLNVP